MSKDPGPEDPALSCPLKGLACCRAYEKMNVEQSLCPLRGKRLTSNIEYGTFTHNQQSEATSLVRCSTSESALTWKFNVRCSSFSPIRLSFYKALIRFSAEPINS